MPRPRVTMLQIYTRRCKHAQRSVGADDPVRPAGCTCKNEYTPANPFTVCRGRCPHRPARRTREIAPIMINCKNPNGFVGEGFYPSWRYNAANWDVPMRNGACCVVAVRHANLLMHRAWEGQSPSPAACRAILRFYDTRWQICRCTTGGQRRPPLQNVVRFCPDACNFAIAYRRRGKPLPYVTTKHKVRLETAKMAKKNRAAFAARFSVLALPIFPVSHPTSIFGGNELNFCVRYGNRWTLIPISTNYSICCALKTGHHEFYKPERHIRACILL